MPLISHEEILLHKPEDFKALHSSFSLLMDYFQNSFFFLLKKTFEHIEPHYIIPYQYVI